MVIRWAGQVVEKAIRLTIIAGVGDSFFEIFEMQTIAATLQYFVFYRK